jgi:hypothetical protein
VLGAIDYSTIIADIKNKKQPLVGVMFAHYDSREVKNDIIENLRRFNTSSEGKFTIYFPGYYKNGQTVLKKMPDEEVVDTPLNWLFSDRLYQDFFDNFRRKYQFTPSHQTELLLFNVNKEGIPDFGYAVYLDITNLLVTRKFNSACGIFGWIQNLAENGADVWQEVRNGNVKSKVIIAAKKITSGQTVEGISSAFETQDIRTIDLRKK